MHDNPTSVPSIPGGSFTTDWMIQSNPASKLDQGATSAYEFSAEACLSLMPVILLIAVLYRHIAVKLVNDWYQLPDFSHGFLIPFFVLFLAWRKRKTFLTTSRKPSWAGLAVVAAGLVLLVIGVLGADLFLSRISFVVLAAGLIWTLVGKAMLSETKFMLAVMLLAIPLPTLILNQVTFPLQLMATRLSSTLLPLAGVPVLRDGNVIQLSSIQLEVAEACSGIRSLISLLTVTVIYGYLLERTLWRRVTLALASIPIAVLVNVVRIFLTGLFVHYWNPRRAVGFFHEFSGWLMFVVSLGLLYAVHGALRTWTRRSPASV